jgi:hypothetical protein
MSYFSLCSWWEQVNQWKGLLRVEHDHDIQFREIIFFLEEIRVALFIMLAGVLKLWSVQREN